MNAQDAMTRQIVTISPNASLFEAWSLMIEYDIRHLLVLERGELQGILSDRDVLYWSKGDKGALDVPGVRIDEVMTEEVLTCRPSQSIASIADMMLVHKIDALPVVEVDGALQGLITSSDLLSILAGERYESQPLASLPFAYELVDWKKYSLAEIGRPGEV